MTVDPESSTSGAEAWTHIIQRKPTPTNCSADGDIDMLAQAHPQPPLPIPGWLLPFFSGPTFFLSHFCPCPGVSSSQDARGGFCKHACPLTCPMSTTKPKVIRRCPTLGSGFTSGFSPLAPLNSAVPCAPKPTRHPVPAMPLLTCQSPPQRGQPHCCLPPSWLYSLAWLLAYILFFCAADWVPPPKAWCSVRSGDRINRRALLCSQCLSP